MTEPTDAELLEVIREAARGGAIRRDGSTSLRIARAVLAKWGTPPAVAPWRSAVLDLIDECPGLTMEQDHWLSRRVKELDFSSTPQPTQAQAGAVPLTRERVKAILTECGYDGASAQHRADFINGLRHGESAHGIKGGHHGL